MGIDDDDRGVIGKVVCYCCGHVKDVTFLELGVGPCSCGGSYREVMVATTEECEEE